jgi:hypothetical protein
MLRAKAFQSNLLREGLPGQLQSRQLIVHQLACID